MSIDGEPDNVQKSTEETAEVEIVKMDQSNKETTIPLISKMDEDFRFSSRLEDVNISVPASRVCIGDESSDIVLIAPTVIEAKHISFMGERLVAESRPRTEGDSVDVDNLVYLHADHVEAMGISSPPTRYGNTRLALCGAEFKIYPWRGFFIEASEHPDERTSEAFRRLKKILRLFRRLGRDEFAKYRKAIEHPRRTNGSGQKVLDQLIKEGVLTGGNNQKMYYLHLDQLQKQVGLSLIEARQPWKIRSETASFLRRALDS